MSAAAAAGETVPDIGRSVSDHIGDAVVVCDAAANVLCMSPGARRMHGLAETEPQAMSAERYRQLFDLRDPDTGESLSLADWATSLLAVQPARRPVLLDRVADEGRSVLLLSEAIALDAPGAGSLSILTFTEALGSRPREGERTLRTVIEALPIGVWFTDAEGRIVLGNSAGQRIWAGARYVGPEDYAQYEARWAKTGARISSEEWGLSRALKGEESRNEIIEIDTFDDQRKIIRNSALPFCDDEGRIIGALAINEDITEQWQAQEEQQRLVALVESSTDAIIGKTIEGIITSWNRGAEEMYGFSRAEAIGAPITMIIPSERKGEAAWLMEVVRRGEVLRGYQTERVRHDGSRVWVSLSLAPVRNAAGRIVGAASIARDISKMKETEERLEEKTRALEYADRRKDELLAMLAHELRNPLAPLKSSAELIRLGDEEGRYSASLDVIERQIRLMTRLLGDLLDVSRSSRGLMTVEKQTIDLCEVVNRALEIVGPQVDERNHQLDVIVPDTPLAVHGDPQRLVQVVVNLLNNAAKYTQPGGRLALTLKSGQRRAVLVVKDDGMGIPPQLQQHIFDLFRHPELLPDSSARGLGLGLTLVRQIVEAHGGSVEVRSAGMGAGSEFTVSLPLLIS